MQTQTFPKMSLHVLGLYFRTFNRIIQRLAVLSHLKKARRPVRQRDVVRGRQLQALRVEHRGLRVVPFLESLVAFVFPGLRPVRSGIRVDFCVARGFDRRLGAEVPGERRLVSRHQHLPRGRRELILAPHDSFGEDGSVYNSRDELSDLSGVRTRVRGDGG